MRGPGLELTSPDIRIVNLKLASVFEYYNIHDPITFIDGDIRLQLLYCTTTWHLATEVLVNTAIRTKVTYLATSIVIPGPRLTKS